MSEVHLRYSLDKEFSLSNEKLKMYLKSKTTFREFKCPQHALDYYQSDAAQSTSSKLMYLLKLDQPHEDLLGIYYLRNYAAFMDWLQYIVSTNVDSITLTGETPKKYVLPLLKDPEY